MGEISKRLESLDALRGVAILCVIVSHTMGANEYFANAGVILFFFLSGFLMDRNLAIDPNLFSYAVRRSFRILPMYWASILLVVALDSRWTFGQILANATFTAPLFGTERMLGVYWTLYIEVFFYCLAPIAAALGTRGIAASTYIVLAIILAIASFRSIGAGAPLYIAFCFCGMQIGAWYRGAIQTSQVWISILVSSIIFGAMLPGPTYVGFVPVICGALLIGCLTYAPRFKPLAFVGLVSYSWYLLHTAFGYSLGGELIAVMTFGLSVATYFVIEKPVIALGRAAVLPRKPITATR